MAGRGGRRPGAGRPPKHVVHETPIRAAEKKILDRLPWIVDRLFLLVEGIYEEKEMGQDTVIVFKRPPDRQAAEYLIDRVMGKSTQSLDVTGRVEHVQLESARTVLRVVGGTDKRAG